MRTLWTTALLCFSLACRDPNTPLTTMPPPTPQPTCGDGIVQPGETCDGADVGTETCQGLGFDTGRLVCNAATCQYDTSLCVKRCGNGVLDLGETCDGRLGLSGCADWGFNQCTDQCVVDQSHCVSEAFDEAPPLELPRGGPAVVGDFNPVGPGDLLVVVPTLLRLELVPWNMTRGFDATASRKLSFLRTPRHAEIADLNADGVLDAVALNDDGTVDLFVNQGATYGLTATFDGGCPTATFLAQNGAPANEVTLFGCDAMTRVSAAGISREPTPQARGGLRAGPERWWFDDTHVRTPDGGSLLLTEPFAQAALADLDADGDLDLVGVSDDRLGVQLLENTGTGFAARQRYTAPAVRDLRALDVDGDGLADVAWVTNASLVVRRNRGSFVFSEWAVPFPMASAPALAPGDVDGDGDLDVVVTSPSGGDATRSLVFLNRAR